MVEFKISEEKYTSNIEDWERLNKWRAEKEFEILPKWLQEFYIAVRYLTKDK